MPTGEILGIGDRLQISPLILREFKDILNADLKICQYVHLHMKIIYAEDFTSNHLLRFEICAREICKKFLYKHSETTEYVKN